MFDFFSLKSSNNAIVEGKAIRAKTIFKSVWPENKSTRDDPQTNKIPGDQLSLLLCDSNDWAARRA